MFKVSPLALRKISLAPVHRGHGYNLWSCRYSPQICIVWQSASHCSTPRQQGITKKVQNHGKWDFPNDFISPNLTEHLSHVPKNISCTQFQTSRIVFRVPAHSNPPILDDEDHLVRALWTLGNSPTPSLSGFSFLWVQRQEARLCSPPTFIHSGTVVCLLPTKLRVKPSLGLRMNETWSKPQNFTLYGEKLASK